MSKKFIQISTKPGFMKFNGGILLRKISKNEYEFKVKVKNFHVILNSSKLNVRSI